MKKYPLLLKPVIKDYLWGGRRLIEEFGFETDKEIAAVSALGFDGYRVALDAIARANSTDTKVIRDAVAATKDFDGATGKITFDANGDATKDAYIKTVENGKFKFLTIVEP